METLYSYYFVEEQRMSGIKVSKQYEDTIFVDCNFHPEINGVTFKYCVFVRAYYVGGNLIPDADTNTFVNCRNHTEKYNSFKTVETF